MRNHYVSVLEIKIYFTIIHSSILVETRKLNNFSVQVMNKMDYYKTVCSSGTLYSSKKRFLYEFINITRKNIEFSNVSDRFASNHFDRRLMNTLIINSNDISTMINGLDKIIRVKKNAINSKKKRLQCLRHEAALTARTWNRINEAVLEAPELGIYYFLNESCY